MSLFNPNFTKKEEKSPEALKPIAPVGADGKDAADPKAVDPKVDPKAADPKADPKAEGEANAKPGAEAKPKEGELPKLPDDGADQEGDGQKPDPKPDPKKGADSKKEGAFGKSDEDPKNADGSVDVVAKYEGVSFKNCSPEKCFVVIAELLMEIKKLRKELDKNDDENLGFYKASNKANAAKASAEGKIEYLARKLSPTYAKATIDNSLHKYTPDEMIDLILRDVLENRKALVERVVTLNSEVINDKRLLEELKNQLASAMSRRNASVQSGEEIDIKPDDIDKHMQETGVVPPASAQPSSVPSIAIVSVDLDQARAALGDVEYDVIQIMGETGLSLYPDIEAQLIKAKGYTESKIKTAFARLEQYRIIETDTVKTAKVKRGIRITELTAEIGKNIYKERFNKTAVQSQKSQIIADHGNLVHGYSIMETADILRSLGYANVTTGRRENSINVGDNKYWIPDIIADNPITHGKEYFEVEFGNHNAENFEDKLIKANLKANVLYFVVPSEIVKDSIKQKVINWKASMDSQKRVSMKVSICTIADIEDKSMGCKID